ncbi:MAG: Trk system potassium transporter TrkA [Bacteroidales bacterium]
MKIIIAGAGEVGTHLAKMLSNEKHDIVVIDPDTMKLGFIEQNYDLLTVRGSTTSFEVLRDANIKKCDLFISVAPSEETNITGAILAKKLGAKKTIARIDSSEYLIGQNREYFTSLGIDSMIYPERLVSREIITLLNKTSTTDFVDYAGGKLSLYVIKLDENAPVISKSLLDIAKKNIRLEYRAVAITRNGETIIPRGCDQFLRDDLVYVITGPSGINEIMKYSGKQDIRVKNIMILGGSKTGIRTALDFEHNSNIKLIEIDKEKCNKIAELVDDTLIINGDGRNIDFLKESGAGSMDAFIAVTGSAEINILSCIIAKKLGVKKIICEVENFDYISIAENMGLDTIINKKVSTASRIFRYTMDDEVSSIKCLTGTDAEILEYVAKPGSIITRAPVKAIDIPKDAIIGGVIRGKSSFIAHGNTQIKSGDTVIVFALPSAIYKVGRFFK